MKTLEANHPAPTKGRHLSSLLEEFVKKFPRLQSQFGSYNKCKLVSYELVIFLRKRGFKARLVHVQHCPSPSYPNPHPNWAVKRRDKWSHYVVAIGRWSVDLTARQFDISLPVPFIQPLRRLREQWVVVEYDRFLNNWVAEVLQHKDSA